MNAIVADPHMIATLGGIVEPVDIRDSSGKLLGRFTPACADDARLYEQARKLFDPAELRRRNETNAPGITTAELLAKLEALDSR
jgi:hypothetical protein